MFTLDHSSCADCTNRRSVHPPCINIRLQPPPGVILVAQEAIGWTCPFKASWEDVLGYIEKIKDDQKSPPVGINQLAFDQLKIIKEKISFLQKARRHMPEPSYLNFLTGAKTNENNNTTYVLPDASRRLMVFSPFAGAGMVAVLGRISRLRIRNAGGTDDHRGEDRRGRRSRL